MRNRSTWLAANKAALDLRYALQIGDLVNWGNVAPSQFTKASEGMKPLEAAVPWAGAIGNHDTAAVCAGGSACPGANTSATVRDTTAYNQAFPVVPLRQRARNLRAEQDRQRVRDIQCRRRRLDGADPGAVATGRGGELGQGGRADASRSQRHHRHRTPTWRRTVPSAPATVATVRPHPSTCTTTWSRSIRTSRSSCPVTPVKPVCGPMWVRPGTRSSVCCRPTTARTPILFAWSRSTPQQEP